MIWNSPLNKARKLNQDPSIYGTFAEIGAGQEVARFFFLAGQASKTIAKTMSAYDMTFSDEIYGKEESGRYVCESRVNRMLDKEYQLLLRRLESTRGTDTRFFAFADTVATGGPTKRYSHGWIGVRFQHTPMAEPSQIVLHARLLDPNRLQQQETLGGLGVDLVHACFFANSSPSEFLDSLTENTKSGQLSIDLIRTTGPAFINFNPALTNLELVSRGWTEAILFNEKGQVASISDYIYQKPLVIQRGHFNPVTITHLDIMQKATDFFIKEFKPGQAPAALFEITTHLLSDNGQMDTQSFCDRLSMLTHLGRPTLVTRFLEFYKIKEFLRQSTQEPIAIVIPASHLSKVFSKSFYAELTGGMLEGLGKLLDQKTHFYVYPHKNQEACQTAQTFFPAGPDKLIYDYFKSQGYVLDLAGCDQIDHYIRSEEARSAIQSKQKGWEQMLPSALSSFITKNGLYAK